MIHSYVSLPGRVNLSIPSGAFRRGGDVSKRSQLALLRRGAQLVVCTAQRLKVMPRGPVDFTQKLQFFMGKLWKISIFNGKTMERSTIFHGKTMERSTIFHGNIHYFDWAIFISELSVYQAGYVLKKKPISGTAIWDRFF